MHGFLFRLRKEQRFKEHNMKTKRKKGVLFQFYTKENVFKVVMIKGQK